MSLERYAPDTAPTQHWTIDMADGKELDIIAETKTADAAIQQDDASITITDADIDYLITALEECRDQPELAD